VATTIDLLAMARARPAGDGFYVATLMFQRAQQLRAGARPRVDPRGHSVVKVAVLEVMAGLVTASLEAAAVKP
jgi:DNA-directed RNA polymerase subunit K/omega